jgi:hypothetical protein
VSEPTTNPRADVGLELPAALAEAFAVGFSWDYDDETDTARGCDFEPYDALEDPERTAWWFRLWTGNPEADGAEFRFFGRTGAGDYAGFWLARPGEPLEAQPVVLIGSEGERGVLARNLGDLLWLFAAGYGPHEALWPESTEQAPDEELRAIAERYAPDPDLPADRIVVAAQQEFPGFSDLLDEQCR